MTREEFLALPLEKKIGQTAIVRPRDPAPNPELGQKYEEYRRKYGFGGYFIGAEVIGEGDATREELSARIARLRAESEIAPAVCADAENGFGAVLRGKEGYPHLMALGAAGDSSLAYDYGRYTALDCRAAGIDWVFAPVADLNKNRMNPIDNIRSIGDSAERALPLLRALVRGLQEGGVAATAKHFPGDGVDFRDQHLCKSRNTLPQEEWEAEYGRVFRALIAEGVMAVMPGHISLSWRRAGNRLPATLSADLLEGLLRRELGFNGLIVSDALEMGGFRQEYFDQAKSEVECFKAGVDMLLWPSEGYFAAMERAIESGEVSQERLNAALCRIWEFKNRLGLFGGGQRIPPQADAVASAALGRRVAERSITLLKNKNGAFPADASKISHAALLTFAPNPAQNEKLETLAALLEERGIRTEKFGCGIGAEWLPTYTREAAERADLVVCAATLLPHEPLGLLDFSDREIAGILNVFSLSADKLVFVSFGSPYIAGTYFPAVPVAVNAYSNVQASREAFVRALFGEIAVTGSSPVHLPEFEDE